MNTIFLALGSNVGDKKGNIFSAIELLKEKVSNIVSASLYETKPWGFSNQENFYNTVIKGQTMLSPKELLCFIQTTEHKVGRIKRFLNGPREIDIDIIFYNDLVFSSPELTIPHASMHQRDFVLQPLMEIAPEFVHSVYGKTMNKLLAGVSEESLFILHSVA